MVSRGKGLDVDELRSMKGYRPDIDGLRALAILPVIVFHAGVGAFSGGFVGVDVFFVISGYLITVIILEDKERGSSSIIKFYERRVRRIVPALIVVVVFLLYRRVDYRPPRPNDIIREDCSFLASVRFEHSLLEAERILRNSRQKRCPCCIRGRSPLKSNSMFFFRLRYS